ncbi:bifunctional DNA-formamidopyrimidine glycosylase/DNA-(apurinic or apyrimidinic site) lyase [Buchananella hordeovulneris]|uniref:bifunctional DNA-formamidopyrimidine glycosylase/DNA-(apurinic or apyrimidinic site) lyase n=1 Tax=Buchananella hordeovulneris TaxID=52770 RepID=UPI000F5DC235|nr:bifunctional DNA-formamidopyrimidine glycosylase/DNA-(apurinic or apyrimidinic site) lyase [Buchananella hordeovulneris]RRD44119.1 bifunctional DNA-formamidopyrimidine glycosylase/DNA-(apurinic or apyrimidinic site) lyase [Buchananella hordeovulneris]
MPELAEVETIRLGLAPRLTGASITELVARHPRVTRHQDAALGYSAAVGRTVTAVVRRGKFLWASLGEDLAVLVHLGMSGQLLYDTAGHLPPAQSPADRHLRAVALLRGADGVPFTLRFVDQRTFGYLSVLPLVATTDGAPGGMGSDVARLPSSCAHIARDALDPALDVAQVAAAITRRRTPIKTLLLDQTIVSGIGNIYADEALHGAGLAPHRPGTSLRGDDVARLLAAARQTLAAAIAVGGTSFDALYVDADGTPGYFARQLQVYGRAGEPCRSCGAPLARDTLGGRSTTYCEYCQD